MHNILTFFQDLGFVELEFAEEPTALAIEGDDDSFAVISDLEGKMPTSLEQALMFAAYAADGTYLWSREFSSAGQFKQCWPTTGSYSHKITALKGGVSDETD